MSNENLSIDMQNRIIAVMNDAVAYYGYRSAGAETEFETQLFALQQREVAAGLASTDMLFKYYSDPIMGQNIRDVVVETMMGFDLIIDDELFPIIAQRLKHTIAELKGQCLDGEASSDTPAPFATISSRN